MYLISNKKARALQINIKFHVWRHYTKKMQFLDLKDSSWQWEAQWKNG